MASCGDRGIEYSYPDLDTWRTNDTSDGIIHNTSGAELEKPTKHTEIQERGHFLPAAAGAGSPDEDLYNDDRETSLPAPAESKDAEEPELPQLIKAVSTTRLEEAIEAPVAQAAEDQSKWKEVEVDRKGKEYYHRDSKNYRKVTAKSDWEAVHGGYGFRGKKHVNFTKKLP